MKENLIIFLISGKARNGKTTTANMIKDYLNLKDKKSLITSYGKYIKMYVKEITGWDGVSEPKPRELLQSLGTGIIREKLGKNDFYVKRLDEDMDVYNEYVNYVMIDDVRLPIEMDYYKERYPNKIVTIHINRPNFESDLTSNQLKHVTEVGLDNYTDYDYMIENDGTLDDLRKKVYDLMDKIDK
jgi:dephospho-CoA kinase